MEFILPFKIEASRQKISYKDKILFIGSCFSEEIGNRFKDLKFDVLQNPNGILYDPLSIAASLNSYIQNKQCTEDDLYLLNDLWHSWQHHSAYSGMDKAAVLKKINQSQSEANSFLKTASWLLITLGTSYNYKLKTTGQFVANCHKAPADLFEKKLIETSEILNKVSDTIKSLRSYNPGINIILTVSPVRHVRDGIVENNRSKARLIEAAHELAHQIENVFYFPAYELVIDVLRDYRFFKKDMVHPNETAIAYVFEVFSNTYLDEASKKLITQIQPLLNGMKHKPFYSDSPAHKNFLNKQLALAQKLVAENPWLDLQQEISYFSGND